MQYTVESGDSVSIIARDIVGDISRWPEVATLNNLKQPYTIYPGQVLQLPDPGTLTLGPATTAPAATSSDWWKNPWLWAGAAALAWFLSQQKTRRKKKR